MASLREDERDLFADEDQEQNEDAAYFSGEEVKGTQEESKAAKYLTTNLICSRNITLADVEIESYSTADISKREADLIRQQQAMRGSSYFVDPRAEVKEAKREGGIQTLVDYEEVASLASQAA